MERVITLLLVLVMVLSLAACGEPAKPTETLDSTPVSEPSHTPTEPSNEPTGTEPTDPAPTETVPTEPLPTEPLPTEPLPTEPAPTEPAPTEPAPTEPAPTEPAPTEPAPTEPAPTEPLPTEPAPTEPEPTEPAPTEPEPPVDIPEIEGVDSAVGTSDAPFYEEAGIHIELITQGPGCYADDSGNPILYAQFDVPIKSSAIALRSGDERTFANLEDPVTLGYFYFNNTPIITDGYDGLWDESYVIYESLTDNPKSANEWIKDFVGYTIYNATIYTEIIPWEEYDKYDAFGARINVGFMDKYTGVCFPACWTSDSIRHCSITVDGETFEITTYASCFSRVGEHQGEEILFAVYDVYLLAPEGYDGAVAYIAGGDQETHEQIVSIGNDAIHYNDLPLTREKPYFYDMTKDFSEWGPDNDQPDEPGEDIPVFTGSSDAMYIDKQGIVANPVGSVLPDISTTVILSKDDVVLETNIESFPISPDIMIYSAPESLCLDGLGPFGGDYDEYDLRMAWLDFYYELAGSMTEEEFIEKYKDYVILRAELSGLYVLKNEECNGIKIYVRMGVFDKYTGICMEQGNSMCYHNFILNIDEKEFEVHAITGAKEEQAMGFNGAIDYLRTISYANILVPKDYDGLVLYCSYSDPELTGQEEPATLALYHEKAGLEQETYFYARPEHLP